MNGKLIQVEDVYFTYKGGIEALKGINLEIDRGEFISIIGQNGSGKTTLAKHMNRLLLPTRGRVLIDGKDTREMSVAEASKKVGYVFQNPEHQIFANTIFDEVAFGLRNVGFPQAEIEKRVKEVLKAVRLKKPLDFFPHFLSMGEKHRLAMASVLALEPDLIILDEPTTGIDYRTCLQIMDILKRLNEEGKSVILITHDLYFAAEYTERVIVLREGRKVADGKPEEVLSNETFLLENSLIPLQVTSLAKSLKDYGVRENIVKTFEFVKNILAIIES